MNATNGSKMGPFHEFMLLLYSLMGPSNWTVFNKFAIRFRAIVEDMILIKENEILEETLRMNKMKQAQADALRSVNAELYTSSLPMEDDYVGSDDDKTMFTATNNNVVQPTVSAMSAGGSGMSAEASAKKDRKRSRSRSHSPSSSSSSESEDSESDGSDSSTKSKKAKKAKKEKKDKTVKKAKKAKKEKKAGWFSFL